MKSGEQYGVYQRKSKNPKPAAGQEMDQQNETGFDQWRKDHNAEYCINNAQTGVCPMPLPFHILQYSYERECK